MRRIKFKGYGVILPKNTVSFKEQIRYRISEEKVNFHLLLLPVKKP